MNIFQEFSLFFALSLVIVLPVSKAEGSEKGDEEKGGVGREEGLNQFRRGRILNSGDMCDLCYCLLFYLSVSIDIVLPILIIVNNVSSNCIKTLVSLSPPVCHKLEVRIFDSMCEKVRLCL